MTATLTRVPAAGVDSPAAPVGRRGRWRLLAGMLVVAASAAGFVLYGTAASQGTEVLVVARPVPVGQPIAAVDVRVSEVTLAPGVAAVPAGEIDLVVGRPAAVPLAPGALLAPGQVGPAAVPAGGEVLVAVQVPLPPAGLAAGARVRVLVTPAASGAAGSGEGLVVAVAEATVVEVGPADGTGGRVVSLLLRTGDGQPVAAAAADGRVSLIVEPG